MSETKYFLDTNAIIALLNGNTHLEKRLYQADWIGTSVVCVIEFLSFSSLTGRDKNLLNILMQRISVLPIENSSPKLEKIAIVRQQTRLNFQMRRLHQKQ
jgi:hypothetical protein